MDRARFLELRNHVIEKFDNLEFMMNVAISCRYFGHANRDFMFPVLHSPYFSSALRVDVISKIIKDFNKDIKNKLLNMGNIRNIFAHITPNYFDGGENMAFENVGWFPDPKDPSKKIDFEKEHEEFFEMEKEVLSYISGIVRGLQTKS